MTPYRRMLVSTLVLATLSAASPASQAQDGSNAVSGYFAFGAAILPEYEGADALQGIPFIAGRLQWGHEYIAIEGTSVRANILSSPSWELGPIASWTFGRDDDVENAAVARMAPVDDTLELGGFVAHSWADVGMKGDALRLELKALGDTGDVHGGWQSTVTAGYMAALDGRWTVGADVSATLASDDFANTYFGVSATDAAASGLPAFRARGGLKDVGISVNASYALDGNWSLVGYAGYRRLVGDAADSPIVDHAGSPDQFSAGMGVGFSF